MTWKQKAGAAWEDLCEFSCWEEGEEQERGVGVTERTEGKKVSRFTWHRALNDCQVECVLHAHFDCEAQPSCRVKHPECSMQLMSEAVQPRGFWKLASAQYEGGEQGWSRNVNRDCVKAEASFSSCCFLWLICYVLLILFWHVLQFLE